MQSSILCSIEAAKSEGTIEHMYCTLFHWLRNYGRSMLYLLEGGYNTSIVSLLNYTKIRLVRH